MLQRLWQVIRSFFGRLIRGMEDPEMLLRQYIDDMRSKVPKLRAVVAEVLATEYQLRDQADQLRKKIADLDKQIISALKLGYEEEARVLIAAKNEAEESLQDTLDQLASAEKASQQARAALDDYQREMQRKIAEAQRLIGQAQMAKMQEELAHAMAAFNIGQPSDVLERMRAKVAERASRAKARVEVATTGVDSRLAEIRKATAQLGVEEQLLQYKRQLGMLPAGEPTAKEMQPLPEQTSQQS
ncbi:MAG: PspA/IM30 family protein [Armatimonadetes bacterium]|nr:PspA/IM30 family protein [Armatimonadota bacterium]MDW8122664.1 PspA/IM30 family protein [Armatimonadota bacterium]